MRLLDATPSRRIALVAPAGYGKTTLARQWVTQSPRKGVWFRATPASTDVAALALGVAQAAEEVQKGSSERLQERLRTSHSPNAEADRLGAILNEDLSNWPDNVWFVVDDYHHLADEPKAELFVDALMSNGNIPLLITSRVRPSWATARRLLYGEVAEFGRNVLAMTHEEAARAVRHTSAPGTLAGLVALAEGWPAVIGLVSLLQSPLVVTGDEMPEALHSYFAEEVYQGICPNLQLNLAQLSLASTIDLDLASMLFGDNGPQVLEQACARGFLSKDGDVYDLHPLLRQFLRSKLSEADPVTQATTVDIIATYALDRAAWDDAFGLVAEFKLSRFFKELLTRALDDLLAKGRLATLEQWLKKAHQVIPAEEVVQLVEVELAFRKGRWSEAEAKARQLARRLPETHPMASKALFRAAQVAQLDDRQDEAFGLLSEARTRSTTSADLRRALWTRFLTLTDLEEPVLAGETLRELEALPPESVEDVIRLSQGPLHFAVRWGGVREQLERHRTALDLVDDSADPLVRSGFLQSYGTALMLAARYEEAYELADRQMAEAKKSGLDWVRPHGLELRAVAQIGLRDFAAAKLALKRAYKLAEETDDYHAQVNATALLARILLAQGEASQALEILEPTRSRAAGPGMEGEIRSMRAVAFASMGCLDEADMEIEASASITSHLEARGLRSYVRILIAHSQGEASDVIVERLTAALSESSVTGNADSFVTSYRAFPSLLRLVAESHVSLDEFLVRPVRSYDANLAERAGLSPRRTRLGPSEGLTEREQEVLALLRQGLSNRQIARTLWIAESTAKVHVRHIFDKLGVRSRTEAALFRGASEN
jgi:ATP/maltotriose-dependent transcriptional regulator MalT